MVNKMNAHSEKPIRTVYILLCIVVLAVFWQVHQFDFIKYDDPVYVTENGHVLSGLSVEGMRWAFSTTYAEFWHPLTWLSLMIDNQIHGLNAGGYHMTNLILHILSTLLLFQLLHRSTGEIWKSSFVAACFALHPLRVESVAWIAERKDVLSALFWMLTLRLYIHYTEKPAAKRYVPVLFSFILALMSKPMAVTLPVIMLLLDYWPLKRIAWKQDNLFLWQLKEKTPFFLLSFIFSYIAVHAQYDLPIQGWPFPLASRLINATISFMAYLGKIFWPYDLSVCYLFIGQAPVWLLSVSILFLLMTSALVIAWIRRFPFLLVGWLWYGVSLLPVLGVIPAGNNAMADRYAYLPSIGISIMLAWGVPYLFKGKKARRFILMPANVVLLVALSSLTWLQCGYWKNGIELFTHASQVVKKNPLVFIHLGNAFYEKERFYEALGHYHAAMRMTPLTTEKVIAYDERGIANYKMHQLAHIGIGSVLAQEKKYHEAINHYNQAMDMTPMTPDHKKACSKRGIAYAKAGQRQRAADDFNHVIRLDPDDANAYHNRGVFFAENGFHQDAIADFNQAIRRAPNFADAYYNRGIAYTFAGGYHRALEDFNRAIRLKSNYVDAYNARGSMYFMSDDKEPGCRDAEKSCALGDCALLEMAKSKGYCH